MADYARIRFVVPNGREFDGQDLQSRRDCARLFNRFIKTDYPNLPTKWKAPKDPYYDRKISCEHISDLSIYDEFVTGDFWHWLQFDEKYFDEMRMNLASIIVFFNASDSILIPDSLSSYRDHLVALCRGEKSFQQFQHALKDLRATPLAFDDTLKWKKKGVKLPAEVVGWCLVEPDELISARMPERQKMPAETNKRVKKLLAHCRKKLGTQEELNSDHDEIEFTLGGNDPFAYLYLHETPPVLILRCDDSERKHLAKESSGITVSDRIKWHTEGWSWIDVELDGTISEATLLTLIDNSHQLVLDSGDEDDKHEIELIRQNPSPHQILSDLISWYGLSQRRADIEKVTRQAALLKTHSAPESKIALGETKIGGRPDLPKDWEWPKHSSGKSLAFIAQINLSEVHNAVAFSELPESGILYIFSVYGWQEDDDSDPKLPKSRLKDDWNEVLFHPNGNVPLTRRRRPSDVNGFKAARVEAIPVISLPDEKEPAMRALKWRKGDIETFAWKLTNSFNKVRNSLLGNPANHLLLGFADYEQHFATIVAKHKLQLLFQIDSDVNTKMCWGDGGRLYFWIKPADLNRCDFSNVFVDYQCG